MSSTYTDLQYTTFPDEIQNFIEVVNILASDAPYINGFQEAMRNGDYSTAQQYFSQIPDGNKKFLDAEKINTLLDTCISLERFYNADIMPIINNLQTEWLNIINRFNYMGDWNGVNTYYKNNFVSATVDGVYGLYLCKANSIRNIPVTNTTYWRELTIRGAQGESGDTMTFRYSWSSDQIYSIGDVVDYNDALWYCKSNNSNIQPSEGSQYWDLIYQSSQYLYPFSSQQPSSLDISTGGLWFEIIS